MWGLMKINKNKWKQGMRFACILFINIVVCIMEIAMIQTGQKISNIDNFRNFQIESSLWSSLEKEYGRKTPEFYDKLTICMLQSNFNPENHKKAMPGFMYKIGLLGRYYKKYRNMYRTILDDIECFPVAEDRKGGEKTAFDDSWGGTRTFGGKRKHEGTDIMTSNNKRGYFPIVSVSDGVVEKKGWLPQGGYRLGIRSPKGAYFYYAHLDSYAEGIEEGTKVRKGDYIGLMGDTGYSEIEGTVGNFDVHLHMGVYLDYKGKEMSVNPYYILKYYENKKLKFCFKNE
ncbi:M23 family metallopeptidase [[Clostridium] polysaccharolyticum]|uniref:Peptidase family M23 n=1 Tax=[Clostridium] polysaccharolyticum TaxID=29364 RepID=A0A1I0AXP4_9FIRM|nr:M23 family metallopeptidase [[Clostridium] polysaccharolyticum]SES99222.1 Peptidase family M23 [[Clostridium] polysaccharolyticum]